MKIAIGFVVAFFSSQFVLASMECEKKLSNHFGSLQIDVKKPMKSQDYLNGEFRALGAKVYKADSKAELDKSIEAAKKYETMDSRYNEIIRVCSSIRAFAEVGISADEIELKTLPFQNGWSEPMRAPLKAVIKEEIKQLKANNEIEGICFKNQSKGTSNQGTGTP